MDSDLKTIEIGVQLLSASLLMLLMTMVHGLGLVGISNVFKLKEERLKEHDFDVKAVALMCAIGLALFALHMVEIALFAVFYLAVDAMRTLEEALYYSASAYATLGRTAEYFPDEWRLMGAIEALIGFLLIGWSTAFIVRNVEQLRSRGSDAH